MAALVCKGRSRPKVRNCTPSLLKAPKVMISRKWPFIFHVESWVAMRTPTTIATNPNTREAIMK